MRATEVSVEVTSVKLFGEEILDQLMEENQIKVNGTNFTVIGYLEEKMNGADGTDDDMVLIPVNVAQRTLKIKNVTMFMASASSSDTVDLAMRQIKDFLFNIFKEDDKYICFTQESILGILRRY